MRVLHAGGHLFIAALMLIFAGIACSQLGLPPVQQAAWTPVPITEAARPTAGDVIILPTIAITAPAPTQTTVPTASAPTARAVAALPSPTTAPTADPHHVVITEDDIAAGMAGGASGDTGAQTQGLAVHFAGGKTLITADAVSYGPINVTNLKMAGVLVARDGALQMDVESVEPQGLVGAVLPGMVNQALKQYASQWYVEDVQTFDGRIELRIR